MHKVQETQGHSNATEVILFGMKFGMQRITPMMQLTMTGEYAVRAMVHLSSLAHGTVVSVADISRDWDVPVTFLRKIVTKLVRAGMINSFRGNGGGIALARPAHDLTLLDVIEASEGTMGLNICLLSLDACHRTPWCAVHTVWCEAQQKLREVLSSRSLADLAASSRPATQTTVSPHKQRRL
jgi:Rrf2 family protein